MEIGKSGNKKIGKLGKSQLGLSAGLYGARAQNYGKNPRSMFPARSAQSAAPRGLGPRAFGAKTQSSIRATAGAVSNRSLRLSVKIVFRSRGLGVGGIPTN